MKELLSKVLKNAAVRKAAFALVVAVLAALGISLGGCSVPLTPQVARALDQLDCQIEAFERVLPHAAAAEDLVMAARAGSIPYVISQLERLGLTLPEIGALADEFKACGQKPDAPPPEPLPVDPRPVQGV